VAAGAVARKVIPGVSIRAAVVHLALRRLRWGYLTHGEEDPRLSANLALLDAALDGGASFFPA
jgi:hypothetical protein